MKLFRHWARSDISWPDEDGLMAVTAAYAGSDLSETDAQTRADALALVRARWIQNRGDLDLSDPFAGYPPPERPIREPVLWRDDPTGEPLAALTRSRNGYVVLNTTRLMIVDVDHPPDPAAGVAQRLKSLWARVQGEVPAPAPAPLDAMLQTFLARHPQWSIRAYRTHAGFRLLVTHAPLDARDPANLEVMQRLHADFMYVRLCRLQGCYRARLTPKTHRIGLLRPAQAYPFRNDAERAAQLEWVDRYDLIRAGYAVAELAGVYGPGEIHPELAPLVALHDGYAVHTGLPLA